MSDLGGEKAKKTRKTIKAELYKLKNDAIF